MTTNISMNKNRENWKTSDETSLGPRQTVFSPFSEWASKQT